jgi:hypothetical protein
MNAHMMPPATYEITMGRNTIDFTRLAYHRFSSKSTAIVRPKPVVRQVYNTIQIRVFFKAFRKRGSRRSFR